MINNQFVTLDENHSQMKKTIYFSLILLCASCFSTKKQGAFQENTSKTEVNPVIITQEQAQDSNTVFVVVEKMPEFPGGQDSLLAYLSRTIKYPQEAKEKGIKGKVYAQFIIEQNGEISDIKVIRGIGGGCDEEAINAIKGMPIWSAGTQRGKPVRVRFVLPINFTLSEAKPKKN